MPGSPPLKNPANEATIMFMDAIKEAKAKGELTDKFMWDKSQEIIGIFQQSRGGLGSKMPAPARSPKPKPGQGGDKPPWW
jgi:hypothetical protein